MEHALQDLKYGIRMVAKKPGFSAVIVLTLALGTVATVLAVSTVAFADRVPVPVVYRLTPRLEKGVLVALTIEIRFRGHADGETTLYLPDSWAGEKNLWKEMRSLTIEGASATEPSPVTRLLHHKPGAAITVRYDIVQSSGGDPLAKDGNPQRPVVRPGWFSAVGNGIFAFPQTESPNWLPRPPARFGWGRLPAGWRAASDLDHGKMGRTLTIDDVAASTLLGGADVRLLKRQAGNAQLRLALRGQFRFTDDQLANAAAAIIATERNFWGDPAEPYFVSVTPLAPSGNLGQRGGTGRGDGFAMFLSPEVEMKEIVLLLAHESEHTWLPDRVGGAPNEKNEGHSWFGEGFADYYGVRTLLDAKVFSPKEYVGWWNDMLFRHANSPARNATNDHIVEAYWTDADVRQLPYDRGATFAAYAGALARSATQGHRSLDDVVRRMKVLALTDRRKATELFPIAFRETTGVDISDQIARFIDRGEDLSLPKDAIGACAEVHTVRLPVFDRGFDIKATIANGRVITGVDPHSPAFAAGLRDGMGLIRREGGRIGDSREPIAYVVKDAGAEKTIRYLPVGKDQIEVQEAVLKP